MVWIDDVWKSIELPIVTIEKMFVFAFIEKYIE